MDYPEQTDTIEAYLQDKLTDPSDRQAVKKAVDALLRRGHSYGSIRRVLDRMSVNTEEFPEG